MFRLSGFICFISVLAFPIQPLFAQANCEVIRSVTICEITNDRLITTDSIILQINKRAGEIYTEDISLYYKQDNPVTNLSAWLEDADGNIIRQLKSKEILVANAISSNFYTDVFSKTFTLKHTEYPYRVCYTYQRNYKSFCFINFWDPVLDVSVPTREAVLILKQPVNYEVKIRQQNVALDDSTVLDNVLTRVWKSYYDGHYTEETYSPDPQFLLPQVWIVPTYFNYGATGSFLTWQSFGEWQQRLIDGLDVIPSPEREELHVIINTSVDKRDQIKKLYHYLQDHTRYINVSIDFGGFKPYPASYVSANHFGDCKALTIYMKALLKVAGIESFYVLVNAGRQPEKFYTDFPSTQQFNHVILAVPLENDTIWLENTDNNSPFGYLGTFTQNRPGLFIDGSKSKLVHIPALSDDEVSYICALRFVLNEAGNATVSSEMKLGGYAYEYFSGITTGYNHDLQNSYVHDFLPFASFELNDWRIIKPDRDSNYIVLRAQFTIESFCRSMGKESYFSFYQLQFPSFEIPARRKLPVQIPYPVHKTDTLVYQLPGNAIMLSELKSKEFSCEFGRYRIRYEMNGQQLIIFRDFQLYPVTIPLEKYEAFYKFLSQIRDEEKNKIIYQ